MKSVLFAKATKPKPISLQPVDGLTFRLVETAQQLPPEQISAKLAAFYDKYPRRALRKGQKSIVEQLQDDRDSR